MRIVKSSSTERGRRARGRVSGRSRLRSDRTGAVPVGAGGSFGGSRPREATGGSVLVLLGIVLVQREGELVLDLAHAVGTKFASCSKVVQTRAVGVATHHTLEVVVPLGRDGVAHNTVEASYRQSQQLESRSRWQRRTLCEK